MHYRVQILDQRHLNTSLYNFTSYGPSYSSRDRANRAFGEVSIEMRESAVRLVTAFVDKETGKELILEVINFKKGRPSE